MLLYTPFGGLNAESGIATCCDDLSMIATAIRTLFVETGFSAKTSSGYGLAEERLREGANAIRLKTGYQDIKVVGSSSLSGLRDAAARLREQATAAERGAR